MKKKLFIYISITFISISCQRKEKSSLDSNNMTVRIKYEVFFIHFIHPIETEHSIAYENYVELIKKELLHNDYILTKDNEQEKQNVRKVGKNENITLQHLSKYHPTIHQYRDFVEYDQNHKDAVKIVVTLKKPINDTVLNFNYRSYKKLGHKEWQSALNPGNFRYEKETFIEDEFVNWMIKVITSLTFK